MIFLVFYVLLIIFYFGRLKEPCAGCAPPYGYINNMPLSLETEKFAEEVRKAPISGNLDAPEGGFDAIMQAIVCKVRTKFKANRFNFSVLM